MRSGGVRSPRTISIAALGCVALAACRTILGIDDKYLVDGGEGGSVAQASAGSGDAASGGADAGASCGPLDDPHNCGACGHDCEQGACKDGVCQAYTLALTPFGDRPNGLAVPGDGYVYFGDFDGQTLNQVTDGESFQLGTILASLSSPPAQLVADAPSLYVTLVTAPAAWPVYRIDESGTEQVPLSGTWGYPWALASDQDNLYVSYSGVCDVARVPKDGGPNASLFAIQGGACDGLAADGEHLFATDTTQGTLLRLDLHADAGTAPVTIDASSTKPRAVTVDATNVYWSDELGIYRRAKDGSGTKETLLTLPPMSADGGGDPSMMVPWSLSVVKGRLFYAIPGANANGVVASVGTEPSSVPPVIVADQQSGSSEVVATDRAVYWIEQFAHVVLKRVR